MYAGRLGIVDSRQKSGQLNSAFQAIHREASHDQDRFADRSQRVFRRIRRLWPDVFAHRSRFRGADGIQMKFGRVIAPTANSVFTGQTMAPDGTLPNVAFVDPLFVGSRAERGHD